MYDAIVVERQKCSRSVPTGPGPSLVRHRSLAQIAFRADLLDSCAPALSPSPLGLCNLCRGFPARSILVNHLHAVLSTSLL
jgi:hypothetical protein